MALYVAVAEAEVKSEGHSAVAKMEAKPVEGHSSLSEAEDKSEGQLWPSIHMPMHGV